MGKSKTDDVLTKQAAEIKQHSDKMEEMAAKFTADLLNFKKDLYVSTTSTAKGKAKGASEYITSLNKKFSEFEKQVLNDP